MQPAARTMEHDAGAATTQSSGSAVASERSDELQEEESTSAAAERKPIVPALAAAPGYGAWTTVSVRRVADASDEEEEEAPKPVAAPAPKPSPVPTPLAAPIGTSMSFGFKKRPGETTARPAVRVKFSADDE